MSGWAEPLKEQHYRIHYGDIGRSYDSIMGDYLAGAKTVTVEDPYIRMNHQVQNFVRFCETVVNRAPAKEIHLTTSAEDEDQQREATASFEDLAQSLRDLGVSFTYEFKDKNVMHDRQIRLSNGWIVKIGRGLDLYQKPDSWFSIGANDMDLRPCMETIVDIFPDNL